MVNPQLETFIAAADAGSFSKAAERLFITPTAVIKQINLLEGSLDVKLFDRSHRGLTLTKAGVEALADFIKEIGMPSTLQELGIDDTRDLQAVADSCNCSKGAYRIMTHEEIFQILKECLG